MSEETTLSAKEVAAKLKMEPKRFRALLRKINGKAPGERYAFKPTNPFLKKLLQLIKAQEEKEASAKKK